MPKYKCLASWEVTASIVVEAKDADEAQEIAQETSLHEYDKPEMVMGSYSVEYDFITEIKKENEN